MIQEISNNKDVTYNRANYIGGSDIAAVMGLSRWKTPLKLWCEKTGKLPVPDLSDNEAVEMGTKLEQFVAELFTDRTGKSVRRAPKYYTHTEYPYMIAHVDRLVTGTDELLECKTCSAFKKDEWENDDIPQEYILQVMWYLGITGRKVGHIAVLIGGQSFKYKKIEFDQELFNTMVKSAKDFWIHVQEDTPPAIMQGDDETLKDLYGTDNEVMIELYPKDEKSKAAADDFNTQIAYLQELKGQIKDLQSTQKEVEAQVQDVIKNNLGIKTDKYIVTWKTQERTGIDSKLLKQSEPDTYEKYKTVSMYRVMRIKNNKEMAVA